MGNKALWYTFNGTHDVDDCPYERGHRISIVLQAHSLLEAQRDVVFGWGSRYSLDLTPIGEPVEELNQ